MTARRIEICGGIGAGKTSAASALADVLSHSLVIEQPENTPFWLDYYLWKRLDLQFEKNLSFVLHHLHLICRGYDNAGSVCDFSFFEDLAYIRLMDSQDDRAFLTSLIEKILGRHGSPEKLIVIHCPPQEKLKRILKRGRIAETDLTLEFLDALDRELSCVVNGYGAHLDVVHVENSGPDLDHFVSTVSKLLESRVRVSDA